MMEAFYALIGGDYSAVKNRLGTDRLIERFVLRYAADGTFDQLTAAVEAQDWQRAFMAAHTLKGIALNLALTRLTAAASALTEALRNAEQHAVDEAEIMVLYHRTAEVQAELLQAIAGIAAK